MDSNTLNLLPLPSAAGLARSETGAATVKTATATTTGWSLLAPVLGMAASASLALLSGDNGPGAAAVYAAFSIGLALVYLALLPTCQHGGRAALLLAFGQAGLGLFCWNAPAMLHLGLGLQTVIATLWLLREQSQGERAMAGLMLGLSTGAVVGLGLALAY